MEAMNNRFLQSADQIGAARKKGIAYEAIPWSL
jgi:hypothetical protein